MKNIVKELFKIADKISEFITEPYIYHYYYESDEEEERKEKIKDWVRKKVKEEEREKEAQVFKFAEDKAAAVRAFNTALDEFVNKLKTEFASTLDDLVEGEKEGLGDLVKPIYDEIVGAVSRGGTIYEEVSDKITAMGGEINTKIETFVGKAREAGVEEVERVRLE